MVDDWLFAFKSKTNLNTSQDRMQKQLGGKLFVRKGM
jgi:hypothetical protein